MIVISYVDADNYYCANEYLTGRVVMLVRNFFIVAVSMCVSVTVLGGAMINNQRWGFRTSTDISNRSAVVDLMERKKGGYYDSFNINNTYITSTNIAGDQNNCSQTVSSVGNSGTNVTDATTSSPSSWADGTLGSAAIGNEYQTGLDTALNGGSAASTQGDNSSLGTVGQSNTSSNQASSINDSAISNTAGAINASGGYSEQQITSNQTNSGAQSASMSDSAACNL